MLVTIQIQVSENGLNEYQVINTEYIINIHPVKSLQTWNYNRICSSIKIYNVEKELITYEEHNDVLKFFESLENHFICRSGK